MSALIARKRGPQRRLRRLCTSAPVSWDIVVQGPPGRPDFDDEAFELIGPGNDRAGDGT
jgi:hypothetical protein